jgi:ankyrin repeat protein
MINIYSDEFPEEFRRPTNFHAKSKLLATYPILIASSGGNLEEVKALIDLGVNVNCIGDLGYTPLHAAASSGCDDIVVLLLQSGADPFIKTEIGHTPLDIAKLKCHSRVASIFENWNPEKMDLNLLDLLREYESLGYFDDDFHINTINTFGDSPLHVAVKRKCLNEVRLLLQSGADVNGQTDDGLLMTPLHLSVGQSSHEIMAELLRFGANTGVQNGHGYSALDVAILIGETKVIFYLYEWIQSN